MTYAGGIYVQPTNEYINPARPENADQQILYTMYKVSEPRTRPTRVVSSYRELALDLGDQVTLINDQTGMTLGRYQVVGIYDIEAGYSFGDLPDRKIRRSVVT